MEELLQAIKKIVTEEVREQLQNHVSNLNDPKPDLIGLRDASIRYSIGYSSFFRYFKNGDLTRHKLGGKTFVSKKEIEKTFAN